METKKPRFVSEKKERYHSEVIRLRFEEGNGYKTIARKIPLNLTTIKSWCYTFEAEMYQGEESMSKDQEKDIQEVPQTESEMKAEIARLKESLRKEQLRADAYNEMITLAEERFNIPIRKKSGTKR